jgi:hypothetical protein
MDSVENKSGVEGKATLEERLSWLLARYYPLWKIGEHHLGEALFARITELEVLAPTTESALGLRLSVRVPVIYVGSDSGPSTVYPPELWPMQLSLAIALRLRMLGWWVEMDWPGGITLDGAIIGLVRVKSKEEFLNVSTRIDIPHHRGSKLPAAAAAGCAESVCCEGMTLTLVQAVIAVLEKPWPRKRMLGYYRDWCSTLGTKVAGQTVDGHSTDGIASAVREDGTLEIEQMGGRIFWLVRRENEKHEPG